MYIYLLLLFSVFVISEPTHCGKNSLPYSLEITESNDLVLKCTMPICLKSIIPKYRKLQKNKHFDFINYQICSFDFISSECRLRGEWIHKIHNSSITSESLNLTCCYNEVLEASSTSMKMYNIRKGQSIERGHIMDGNNTVIEFEYISNIEKIIRGFENVIYKVSFNSFQCGKSNSFLALQSNSTKTEEDEDDFTSVSFGVCPSKCTNDDREKQKPSKLTIPNIHPISFLSFIHPSFNQRHKLYQAPKLRNFMTEIKRPAPDISEDDEIHDEVDSSLENEADEDHEISFAAGRNCPGFNEGDDGSDSGDSGGAGSDNANGNANANANGDSNANSNSNANANANSDSNSRSNFNANSNSESDSQSNSNSQNNNNNNDNQNTNQNSQNNNNNNNQNNAQQNNNNQLQQQQQLQQQNQNQNPNNNNNDNQRLLRPPAYAFPFAGDVGASAAGAGAAGGNPSACFSADSLVYILNGPAKRMKDLEIGDWVLSAGGQKIGFEKVVSWLHKMPKIEMEFLKITLANGKTLKITKKHYIYKIDCYETQNYDLSYQSIKLIEAENIQSSDCLLSLNQNIRLTPTRISKIEIINETGIYGPLTANGNIVVNDIFASCYSEIDNKFVLFSIPTLNRIWEFLKIFFESVVIAHQEIDLLPGIENFIEVFKSFV